MVWKRGGMKTRHECKVTALTAHKV